MTARSSVMAEPAKYRSRNRRSIYRMVITGTYLLIAVVTILLWASLKLEHNALALGRLAICGAASLYIASTNVLLYQNHYRIVAYLLTLFYLLLATGMVWAWGIDTPFGLLMFSLVIVLAGILIEARYALFAAALVWAILFALQLGAVLNWHHPDTSWMLAKPNFGDALAYCTVLGTIALVSWLYGREIKRSFTHADAATAALMQQRSTLELKVEEQTAELRRAQLEEMRHMYRFAQLGQFGVMMLHDLANQLSSLTLELELMHDKNSRPTEPLTHIHTIIQYLDNVVANTRKRLYGDTSKQSFNIIRQLSEVVAFFYYRAKDSNVRIDWSPPAHHWDYTGDPVALSQIVAILMSNSIDAYGRLKKHFPQDRKVLLVIERGSRHINIRVSDWGGGITKHERSHLFKPPHSAKKTGLGLGLFIARQTIEADFSGTITCRSKNNHTEFIVKLPLHER